MRTGVNKMQLMPQKGSTDGKLWWSIPAFERFGPNIRPYFKVSDCSIDTASLCCQPSVSRNCIP